MLLNRPDREAPKARFVDEPYGEDEAKQRVREFQEKGYTVLPRVLERESVPEFKAQLEELKRFDGSAFTIPDDCPHFIHCAFAPRGRQLLADVLSHSISKPMPVIHTINVIIETDETRGYAPKWHKDRQPDGMPGREYQYPLDVFLVYYFEDVDEDHGPTQIIPGSHRDVTLLPNSDAPVESILLSREDGVLLDQRAWHRGLSRKVPGTRFVIVYGIYALPHHYGTNFHMPRIQRYLWMKATDYADRVYLGGPFAPPDKETVAAMLEVHEREPMPRITYPRMR